MTNRHCSIPVFLIFALSLSCDNKRGVKNETEEKNNPFTIENDTSIQSVKIDQIKKKDIPIIFFDKTYHDFGAMKEGEKKSYTYTFTNTGKSPLIIQSARPSCGCTVSAWSKKPIPINGTGFVRVNFNSKGKSNVQNKTVIITSNTWPKTTVLHFKAFVTPKPSISK